MVSLGTTSQAEVEITTVQNLSIFASAMKNRSTALANEMATLRVQFSNKASGNEGKAIEQYLATLKGFEDALYEQFPAAINEFAGAFDAYETEITGLGFESGEDLRTSSVDIESYKSTMTNEGSAQKVEVEDRFDGVKNVLNEVAAEVADYESPTSTLDWEKENIKGFLDDLGTAIDNLHTNLTDAKSSFVSKLDAFNSTLEAFNATMGRIQFFSDPNSGFSPANMKVMINSGKMTAQNINDYMSSASSLADSQAISHYLQGKHEEFADLNPDEISQPTYYMISDNINNRLITEGNGFSNDLENFTNAILSRPDDVSNKFFNNLTAGAEKVAYLAYGTAIAINPSLRTDGSEAETTYNAAVNKLNSANVLTGFFQAVILADAQEEIVWSFLGYDHKISDNPFRGSTGHHEVVNTKIKGLKLSGAGFEFSGYQDREYNKDSKGTYYTTSTLSSESITDAKAAAELHDLKVQRDNLFEKWVSDMGEKAITLMPYGSAIVELTNVIEKFGSGTVFELASGTSSTISEVYSEYEKSKSSTAFSAVSKTFDRINEYAELTEQINKQKTELTQGVFDGRGFEVSQGGDTIHSEHYKYDVDAYHQMREWETSGSHMEIESRVNKDHTFTPKERTEVVAGAIERIKMSEGVSETKAKEYANFVLYGQEGASKQSFNKMGLDTYLNVRNHLENAYNQVLEGATK